MVVLLVRLPPLYRLRHRLHRGGEAAPLLQPALQHRCLRRRLKLGKAAAPPLLRLILAQLEAPVGLQQQGAGAKR